jgi:hypothetical protein
MDRSSYSSGVAVLGHSRHSPLIRRFATMVSLSLLALPGFAARVPVRDGQSVSIKLRNILTTDNVRKDDVFEFEVTEDILVNGHVVIAKGATARGKVVEVKGAYKPRDKDAEVVFQFLTVRAVDKQELPLRRQPEKPRKENSKDSEVHEKSAIAGQIMRVVGADKGKEYEAYINGSFTISTSDAVAAEPAVSPATPAPGQPPAPAAAPAALAPASPMAATNVAMAPSSVEFGSTPDGADIVIDGNLVGNTPSTLRLTPGRHAIEIRMAGYRTWSRIMVVDPESHPSVRATLVNQ